MFGIGMPELIIILVIALIIIGPKKLPDLAKGLGKGMAEFKKATQELKGNLDLDEEIKEAKEDLVDSVSGLENALDTAPSEQEPQKPKYQDYDEMLADYQDSADTATRTGDENDDVTPQAPEETSDETSEETPKPSEAGLEDADHGERKG